MAIVLGKPVHSKFEGLSTLPTDTHIPQNPKNTIPLPRNSSHKPDTFTMRLLEYGIQKNLPKIRQLEEDGPYPRDYATVERLHQGALDYIRSLPAIFNLENPDKTFDMDCPWLIPQRGYLHSTISFYIVAIHRPYIFSIRESRREIIKHGIEVLKAQQRFFDALQAHQYKLFTLAYLSFEAAVTTSAVLIAYPAENKEFLSETFHSVQETIRRFQLLSSQNPLASSGLAVIQVLATRAESVRSEGAPQLESKSHCPIDDGLPPSMSYESAPIEQAAQHTHSQSTLAFAMSDIQEDPTRCAYHCLDQNSNANLLPPNTQSIPAYDPSFGAMEYQDDADFGYLISPLAPTADLMYQGIVASFDPNAEVLQAGLPQGQKNTEISDGGGVPLPLKQSSETIPPIFDGGFPDNTFWGFINQGL